MNAKVFIKGLVFLASLAGAAFLFSQGIDEDWIDTFVRGQGVSGELIFLGVAGVFATVGFPRQVISFLGGYAFGFVTGTVLAVMATGLGCALTFTYARVLGRDFVQRKFPRKIKRVDDFLKENPFAMTLLIRLLPVGNNMATSAAAGVSTVRPFAFIFGSLIGYVPQTAVFALAGSGVELDPFWRIGLSVILFIVSGLLGVYLYRRYRHGKTLGREIETQLSGDETKAEAIVREGEDKA